MALRQLTRPGILRGIQSTQLISGRFASSNEGTKPASESYVTLHTGARMPKLGLGTWAQTNVVNKDQHDPNALANAVKVAIEHGYRHIDTAWAYFNEKEIGVVLKDLFDRKVVKREELFIVTKLFSFFHNPEVVEKTLRSQLADLQLDYLDLFLIHSPMGIKQDPKNPNNIMPFNPDGTIDFENYPHIDTWRALESCVKKGLTKHIGISNWNSKQIQRLLDQCEIKPANLQVECHPYFPQCELKAFCDKNGIAFTAYAPIGSPGAAVMSQAMGKVHPMLMEDPAVLALAKKYGKTPAQVLIRWGVDRNTVVIPKSTNPARIVQNFDIFDFHLTSEEVGTLEGLNRGRILSSGMALAAKHPEYPFNEPF